MIKVITSIVLIVSTIHAAPTSPRSNDTTDASQSEPKVTCEFVNDFCGWKPDAIDGSWHVSAVPVNNIAPPEGAKGLAYVASGIEQWATFESVEIPAVHQPCNLTFQIIQERIEISSSDMMAQLCTVSHEAKDNREKEELIWAVANAPRWQRVGIAIKPQTQPFKLRFRLKVGLSRQVAGIAQVLLTYADGDQAHVVMDPGSNVA